MEGRKKRVVIEDSEIKAHLVGCFEAAREPRWFLVWEPSSGQRQFSPRVQDLQHPEKSSNSCNHSSLGLRNTNVLATKPPTLQFYISGPFEPSGFLQTQAPGQGVSAELSWGSPGTCWQPLFFFAPKTHQLLWAGESFRHQRERDFSPSQSAWFEFSKYQSCFCKGCLFPPQTHLCLH